MTTFKLNEIDTDAKMSGADLQDKLYHFCVIDPTNKDQVVLCGDGALPYGVIHETPNMAGEGLPVSVMTGGIAKVEAAAVVVAGAKVASDANGKGVTATTGEFIAGISPEGASAVGVIMSVRLTFAGRAA